MKLLIYMHTHCQSAHALPISHLLSTWTLRGGVTRSTISVGQVLTRFFSETAAFLQKIGTFKANRVWSSLFGAFFKGWSSVSSQMLFAQTDRQTDRQKTHYYNPLAHARWGLKMKVVVLKFVPLSSGIGESMTVLMPVTRNIMDHSLPYIE